MRLEILLTAILFFGGAFFTGYGLRRVLKLHKEGFVFSISRCDGLVGTDGADPCADDHEACIFP